MSTVAQNTVTQTNRIAATTAAASAPRLNANFDTFLKLLTTQLQNQDPTKAMDTNEMTAQLTQFASVEQQLSMNANLERLISIQQAGQVLSASSLMGRQAEVESSSLALQGGAATLRIPSTGSQAPVLLQIMDSQGQRVLRSVEVPSGATWTWDGKLANGTQLPDGAYRIAARVNTENGSEVVPTVVGRVTSITRDNGSVTVGMGAMSVPVERVRSLPQG